MNTDPAWGWIESALQGRPMPGLLVLVGTGTGEVLSALEQHAPDTRVLVLEPEPRTANVRSNPNHVLLADPDYAGADEAWRLFPSTGEMPPVLVHPELQPSPAIARAKAALKKILFGVRANAEARRRFAPGYLINSLRNIPSIIAGRDVRELENAFKGTPAILVAAGPSLDESIDELRSARDHALLISTDTALRPLLAAGIAPQLVVALDPSVTNARHLQSLPACDDTWLVSESAMDPAAIETFGSRAFWFRAADHQPWPWLNEFGLDIGRLDVWGSVLTGAFRVACLAGCDPIIVVGADLSYTSNRPYARGTTYEFDWAWAAAEGTDINTTWHEQIAKAGPIPAVDLHGRETLATPALLSFRDWMVAQAARSGRRVINATGAGVLFGDGVEQMPLRAALSRTASITSISAIPHAPRALQPSALASGLRATAAPLAQWAEFSGGSFDAVAVGTALADAARGLETGRAVSAPAPLLNSDLLPHLPEAIARFRAGLQGDAIEPLNDVGDRATTLVRALDLLARISAGVHDGSDLPRRFEPTFDIPAFVFYEWPDDVRWAVVTFEAMLGQAMGLTLQKPDGRFFAPALAEPGRPSAVHACVLLALEWFRCVDNAALTTRMAGIESAVRASAAQPAMRGAATLRISATAGDTSADVALPLGLSAAALARVLTGTVAGRTPSRLCVETPTLTVSMALELEPPEPELPELEPERRRSRRVLFPRVLSDAVLKPSFVAYGTERGAVCVAPHSRESILVREDGSTETHLSWPRPIFLELPAGDDVIAWSNGLKDWPKGDTPYVMRRHRAGDEPTYDELPFRPGIGAWWRDRMYWACLPSGIGAWTGVASWTPGAPGEDARTELPGQALYGLEPDGDQSLMLHRRALAESGTYARRILTEGWRWQPGQPVEAVDLGPYGASSSCAQNGNWTARAHPEADLIRFESPERTVSLVCHWPHRLAWAGRSLLVNTLEDLSVLFFEDVIGWLERG